MKKLLSEPYHERNIHDVSLSPAQLFTEPTEKHLAKPRAFQGIPGIERTKEGRLFATWYMGGLDEGPENYVHIVRSDDNGLTWSEPIAVVDPQGPVRAYDPMLWIDPRGRLWFFWAQSYDWYNGRAGVFFSRCDEPDANSMEWTLPIRIANGVLMNKPTIRSNGEWLFPVAVWESEQPRLPELKEERKSNVLVSSDEGKTFFIRGGADIPHRSFDEHMIVEKEDGTLWMLVRTKYGIGQSFSRDGGANWSSGSPTDINGPSSRFFIRRLGSNRLLLINHYEFTKRSHLHALLSDDDGRTWPHRLLLDGRNDVSYPDAAIDVGGRIYIIYDRERKGAREILMASVTEEDILAGEVKSKESFLSRVVDEASRLEIRPPISACCID